MQRALIALAFAVVFAPALADDSYSRDPNQAVDDAYGKKITEYTTDPSFNSPLTNYLPASSTVPTPQKVLGDIAGAPNMLPYSKDVYRYFDLLAQSTPRVVWEQNARYHYRSCRYLNSSPSCQL